MPHHIHHGDALDWLRAMPSASADAILTDPPYHLTPGKKGGAGFMGKAWDGGDIAFRVELWAEALRVLRPGGHVMAFSGSRTSHRMVCAIEDAGFEIHETILWLYGQGFPKSHNLEGDWKGYGTALKPAFEPATLARKPLDGTVASNAETHGCGALNIDGCRVPAQGRPMTEKKIGQPDVDGHTTFGAGLSPRSRAVGETDQGRWPANVCHDGSDEVEAAFAAFAAFGELASGKGNVRRESGADRNGNTGAAFGAESRPAGSVMVSYGDSGSASRFFYCAKATRADRNFGLGPEFEAKPLNWSSGDANPGSFQSEGTDKTARNHHPTVKPTSLTRWLATMLLPIPRADGAPRRRLLVPFAGSGSEIIGAIRAGWDDIEGCEAEAEYVAIARARCAAAAAEKVAGRPLPPPRRPSPARPALPDLFATPSAAPT